MPAGRYGTAKEVASLVVFLLGDEANIINGAVYPIDGGLTSL
ncbi:SDR family oxidoreductase [Rossellomorea marisflavi]